MKKTRKLISLLMVAVLCIGLCSGVVLADGEAEADETETLNILALGDSITTGYGLESASTQCFTALLAAATGAAVTNEGVNGQTSTELRTAVAAGTYAAEIAQADIVTITIGGNDLMAAFYQIVADTYNSSIAALIAMGYATAITADDVQAALADPTSSLGQTLLKALTETDLTSSLSSSTVFSDAVTSCITNIAAITTAIKTVNADAVVIVANQYNPYQWLGVETINSLFATAVTAYNTALAQYASIGGYLVADVYTAFSEYTTTLTNADYATYNFDFHPNAAGHVVIANTFVSTYTAYLAEEAESQAEAEAEALVAAAIEQLGTAIAAAQALDESDYTAESWAVLQAALASAQAVLTDLQTNGVNTSLTTTEITAAYLALTNAVSSLVAEEASTTEADGEEESSTTAADAETVLAAAIAQIKAVIAQAEALDENDYSEENWAIIQAALANAQAVLTDLETNGTATSLSTAEILAVYQTLSTVITETETTSEEESSSTTEAEESSTTETEDESDTTAEEEEATTAEAEEVTDAAASSTDATASSTDGTDATTAASGSSVTKTGDVSTWIYFVLLIGAAAGAVMIARKKEA